MKVAQYFLYTLPQNKADSQRQGLDLGFGKLGFMGTLSAHASEVFMVVCA